MWRKRRFGVVLAWAMLAAAPTLATAQPEQPGGEASDASRAGGEQAEGRITFTFKEAPYDQVLDFFARQTGLPIIYEADAPEATMTFISAASYPLDEALTILNLSLSRYGVQLRREGGFLYLSSAEGALAHATPIGSGQDLDNARPEEIVTLYLPLNNAPASVLVEQLKPLIGPLGKIVAVESQNILLIVESAAQCRRLREIVRQIDEVRPSGSITKVFRLVHADAKKAAEQLQSLAGGPEQTVYLDKNQKPVIVDDVSKPSLSLTADERTNSVVAVGPMYRISVVEELISVLDVPEGGETGERRMVTFALSSITAEEAARNVESLFRALPEQRRPTVLALSDVGKVTIIGDASQVAQATALLSEIDPGAGDAPLGPERVARTIVLDHATASQVEPIVSRLLSPRQSSVLRRAPTLDGRGIIVVGPTDDVDSFERLVSSLDTPPDPDKQVRVARIETGDPARIIERAQALAQAAEDEDASAVNATLNAEARTVTLIGTQAGISRFEALLRLAEGDQASDLETRVYDVAHATPSQLANTLGRLVPPLLDAHGEDAGAPLQRPDIEPLDELDQIVVRAEPQAFGIVEELLSRLDAERPEDRQLRIVRLRGADPQTLLNRARELYDARTAGLAEAEAGPIDVQVDQATGSAIISGTSNGVRLFTEALDQSQQLIPPARTTRVYEIRNSQASEIVTPLRELIESADPIDPVRAVPDPTIQVIERTNSLMVTAENAQHGVVSDLINRLDQIEPTDLPPLRLLQLRAADANAIASMLTQQYSKRPQSDRLARPVEVRSDPATNTLVVSAHEELFEEIKAFVDSLNQESEEGPERVTVLFPLKVAKADAVAQAMDKLYPVPPMPRDSRNRPMPWLQKEKEVTVSAEPGSNSLIIDAPAERIESLRELAEKLDRVELPPVAELRTYRIVGADLTAVSRTLQGMSRQGVLSAPPQPGKQPVQVIVETEPMSNTLIVAGDEVTFERVEQVLADIGEAPVERGLRIVPIANADAEDVRERALAIYDAQVAQVPHAGPVDVTVDSETNSLEVVADVEAMDRFMGVLDELQRQAGPARDVRMIELRVAPATEVVSFLRELVSASDSLRIRGGPDPQFEPIEQTNSILVAATPQQMAIIEPLARSLDQRKTAERPPLRILRLRTTDAASIAQVLKASYDGRPVEERARKPVDVSADPATNTLIVSAHAEVLPEIESIVEELNETQTLSAEDREIRIFPLRVARAEELARTIDAMFPEPPTPIDPRTRRPRPDLRQPKEVVVRADPATNSLIVDAPSKRLSGFEQIVSSLDQHRLAADVEVRTYRVERAELAAVQRTLSDLASKGALGQTSAQTPVAINAEPTTRTLIVSGPTEIFTRVETVLSELDTAPDRPEVVVKLYTLEHARAERLEPLLSQLLSTRLREQRDREGLLVADERILLEVASDSASNTLIVSAPQTLQQLASELIDSLDTEAAEIGRATVRVVPLTFADAAEVARTLTAAAPSLELPSGGVPTILAAGGSNAVLLSGAAKDLEKVEELLASLDTQPSDDQTAAVETFPLEHADAGTIAPSVERVLSQQQQLNPQILNYQLRYTRTVPEAYLRPPVNVEADERTNALIISAPRLTLELARAVIEKLDTPAEQDGRSVTAFTPLRGDPDRLVRTASSVLEATRSPGRRPLELLPEPASGAILVIGDEEQTTEALRVLTDLDERAVEAPAVDVSVFDLQHADARGVASALEPLLNDRSRWPDALSRAERAGVAVAQPRVNVDVEANRLVLSAPTPLIPLATGLIETLDAPPAGGTREVRVVRLIKGDAASVAQALQDALSDSLAPGAPAPAVSAETASNSILISGTSDQIDEAADLISSMDDAAEPEGLGVRSIALEHARAEAIAPVVERVLTREQDMTGVPAWIRWQMLQTRGGEDVEIRVAAERRLNAVVVSGPRTVLDVAEELVTQLDQPSSAARSDRLVRVLALTGADASELASSIEAVFEDEGETEPPVVRVDRSSNSLVVRANPEQMETIERLARELDAAAIATGRELRTIPLDRSRVDAQLMANTLKRLLERRGGVKVRVITAEELLEEPVSVEPIGGPSGDARPTPDPARGVAPAGLPCMHGQIAAALAIATIAQPDTDDNEEARDEADFPEPEITIAVDPVSNSLIIVGSSRVTDRVSQLAAELERQMPAEPVAVNVVELPSGVDARAVTQLVNQTVRQVGRASQTNPGGFTGPVAVAADPSGRALIVWANDTDYESVGAVISGVARVGGTDRVAIKVYPLANLTANSAAGAVRDLISVSPRGRQAAQARRSFEITLEDGRELSATLDPSLVRVSSDPGGAALIVAAPPEALPLIDSFVGMIDQSPVSDRLAIRRYELENADAQDVSRTLQRIFEAQRAAAGRGDLPRARFEGDQRTNTLLAAATDGQHEQVDRLLASLDAPERDDGLELEILTIQNAVPSTVQRVVEQVVIGRDPARREKVQISADDDSSILVVRAEPDDLQHIRDIVAQVDTADLAGLPVRSIKLERADAQVAAQTLQQFFQQRAQVSSRGGRRAMSRVAIVGDRQTGTLIVAASDDEFEQIQSLASSFDERPESRELTVRIIQLENARVSEISTTLDSLVNSLFSERVFSPRSRNLQTPDERLYVETNDRTNSVVILGEGDSLDLAERLVRELDRPETAQAKTVLRAVPLENADLRAVADVIEEAMANPEWRWWMGPDPNAVQVEADERRQTIILVGPLPRVEQAMEYIAELDAAGDVPGLRIETIALEHADAARASQSLRSFFQQRARAEGRPVEEVTVIGSREGNVLIVSGDDEGQALVRSLVDEIDQPELGEDRSVEVYVLTNSEAPEVARVVGQLFPRTTRSDERVIVQPMPATNSVIVSAPTERLGEVDQLIEQLDSPPTEDESRVVTVKLATARADEISRALAAALPETLKIKITPVPRNNSLLLTGSDEAIEIVMRQINEMDAEPARAMTGFRRVTLKNADAAEVRIIMDSLLRARPRRQGDSGVSVDYSVDENAVYILAPVDELDELVQMVEELDTPTDTGRRTDFVKLEYADAEQVAKALDVFYGRFSVGAVTPGARQVQIVPDPASNSLVISAGEAEWGGIGELLQKLDSPEYDTSRQLTVIPLLHADAQSVARALNEGFRAPLEAQLRQEQLRLQEQRRDRQSRDEDFLPPAVLVDAEETPAVSAEPLTNALIVFAGRQDLERIQAIVTQLDQPDFVSLPEPRIIPLSAGRASQFAQAIRQMFVARAGGQQGGRRSVLVFGDDSSNVLVVRAEEQEFAQIKALADALQQEGLSGLATPRVVRLRNVPAARLRETLQRTFQAAAQQLGEPLAIEVDRDTNSLVVASSERLYEQIEQVAKELDGSLPAGQEGDAVLQGPGLGRGVFIIDVEHNSPEEVRRVLEQLGVTGEQPPDRPGVVSEPVVIVPLTTRQAIAVVASAADGVAITELVRAIDASPIAAEQHVRMVSLRLAQASNVVRVMRELLDSADTTGAAPAQSLSEQLRRLSMSLGADGWKHAEVDLSEPIRLIPDDQTNSVILSSTPANVDALVQIVRVLDTLPIGEAVVVRIFPLDNASATRVKSVLDELFEQGEALRRLPGTQRQGLPVTATGQALAGEVAISVDDRTNALIVAGREEAVALVEVLIADLDGDQVAQWVEPRIIPLEHADARTLAETLRRVLVDGIADTPETDALQRQTARLRVAREGGDPVDADMFAPLSGLVIEPEEALNALLVVGSPANAAIVEELAGMLDVEAASASNTVRIYPLTYAAADRVAAIVRDIFAQREQVGALRTEDRLIIQSDTRTNSLVVSTSPRSFAILEGLLEQLDGEEARAMVGLHVLPVPGADVTELATKIERLMRERIAAAQRSGGVESPMDTFSIEPEPASNSLIVSASDENLRIVEELVAALLTEGEIASGAAETVLISLSAAPATEVADAVDEIYVRKQNENRGADSVRVVPNERLRALLVTGNAEDIYAITELVGRLDTLETSMVQEIKRIELLAANAFEIVQLVENVLAGQPISGTRGVADQQVTRLRYYRSKLAGDIERQTGVEPTEAEIDGVIRQLVRLTPDLRTNSVLVAAPEPVMTLIEEIIYDLDRSKSGERQVERFQLDNADAEQMALILRDLFNLQQQGDLLVLVPSPPLDDPTRPQDPDLPAFTPVPDERRQLSITIDRRTNSLLVSGTSEMLDQVRRVVTELDAIEAVERVRQVYQLQNAQAGEVEEVLVNFFQGEADRFRQFQTDLQDSALAQLEREVTVVGDEKSNKVLVSASPRYIDTVNSLIAELDAPPPQVMIEVLFAEVTLDDSDQWGVDIQVGPFGNDMVEAQSLGGGAGVSTVFGVGNLSVSSVDFSLLVRALREQGKLEVLSNPQVKVNNNESANINVGDEITIITGTERLADGNVRSDVERIPTGITLEVTPSISQDGFVRMEVRPEISRVTNQTTQISEDFQAPIINTRFIETVVTVRDGETIVLGGLMQNIDEERRTKVPLLGDIPVLGGAFRSKEVAKVKTELLIVLTPRIIPGGEPGVETYRDLSKREINAMTDPRTVRSLWEAGGVSGGAPLPVDETSPAYPFPSEPGPIQEPHADEQRPHSDSDSGDVVEIEPSNGAGSGADP